MIHHYLILLHDLFTHLHNYSLIKFSPTNPWIEYTVALWVRALRPLLS